METNSPKKRIFDIIGRKAGRPCPCTTGGEIPAHRTVTRSHAAFGPGWATLIFSDAVYTCDLCGREIDREVLIVATETDRDWRPDDWESGWPTMDGAPLRIGAR